MNDAPLPATDEQHPIDEPRRSRRHALRLIGGAGLGLVAAACTGTRSAQSGAVSTTSASSSSTSPPTSAATASCTTIPEETAGPYPGDGSNGANVLTQEGVVRSDIRSSFGSSSTVAQGVALTIALQVVDTANGCQPLSGAAVYIWHCDQDGNYSMYSPGVTDENYLRGVQETDSEGMVQFTSIFPACYSGRWPHVHFEVYPSVAAATKAFDKLATSQLALPKDVCDAVFATSGYSASVRNMTQVSLSSDMVFRDGASLETPSVTGSATDGYVATLVIPV